MFNPQEVNRRVDAFRGNPQGLMQKYAVSQDLLDLLALQQINKEKQEAARQMQLQMARQQGQAPTVADQVEKESFEMTRQDMANKMAPLAQMQQQQQMQRVGGISANPAPNMSTQKLASGGIVGYASGDFIENPKTSGQQTLNRLVEWLRSLPEEERKPALDQMRGTLPGEVFNAAQQIVNLPIMQSVAESMPQISDIKFGPKNTYNTDENAVNIYGTPEEIQADRDRNAATKSAKSETAALARRYPAPASDRAGISTLEFNPSKDKPETNIGMPDVPAETALVWGAKPDWLDQAAYDAQKETLQAEYNKAVAKGDKFAMENLRKEAAQLGGVGGSAGRTRGVPPGAREADLQQRKQAPAPAPQQEGLGSLGALYEKGVLESMQATPDYSQADAYRTAITDPQKAIADRRMAALQQRAAEAQKFRDQQLAAMQDDTPRWLQYLQQASAAVGKGESGLGALSSGAVSLKKTEQDRAMKAAQLAEQYAEKVAKYEDAGFGQEEAKILAEKDILNLRAEADKAAAKRREDALKEAGLAIRSTQSSRSAAVGSTADERMMNRVAALEAEGKTAEAKKLMETYLLFKRRAEGKTDAEIRSDALRSATTVLGAGAEPAEIRSLAQEFYSYIQSGATTSASGGSSGKVGASATLPPGFKLD